jgi:asparagine synthase (glutamine-hydrolysing)
MPSSCKVRGGETKWLLKQAYRGLLTDEVVFWPKHGFDMPIDSWLRGPLRETFETAVLGTNARLRDLIDPAAARPLYRAHLSGLGRHGNLLWALLVLARWADRYLGAAPPEPPRNPANGPCPKVTSGEAP